MARKAARKKVVSRRRQPDPAFRPAVHGERVKAQRNALGWNLDKLGADSRVHSTTISEVERNKKELTGLSIVRLAAALDVPTDYLLAVRDADFIPVWRAWPDLADEAKLMIAALVKASSKVEKSK